MRRKEKKEEDISPYHLQSGFVVVCCPMPRKCQGRKEKCEEKTEIGQRNIVKKLGKEMK
jgi:hypothetical protein